MKENNEENFLNEHIKKIKYRIGYEINETPKYKPLIEDDSEFDELPVEIYATQDGQPVPNTGGTDAYLEEENNEEELPPEEDGITEPAEPSNAPEPNQEDIPASAPSPEEPTPETGDVDVQVDAEIEQPAELPAEEVPTENPEQEVNQIQNDIIKHNIEAMKNIQSKLEDLENINSQLSSQLNVLNAKVEEVEEPTNTEKLMAQKDVSYPYYFNLNDFWKNNWFDQQRQNSNEKGIRQLPDGSYIADFDDLPTHSGMDIDDSFNSIV